MYQSISPLAKKFIELQQTFGCKNYAPLPVVLAKGLGPLLFDVDGKSYYDCLSAYSAVNQGHCHPKILKAMTDQAKQLTLTGRAFYNPKLGMIEEKLCKMFKYDKALMMNTGVEAGESALKLARRWGIRTKKVQKPTILFAKGNFWGRTIAACASSDDPDRYRDFGPFEGLNFKLIDFNDVDSLKKQLEKDPSIVAYMVEPIQGQKGVIVPSDDYLPKCHQLLKKHQSLLICDEIQTGLGRTGKWLCSQHYGVRPDIVLLAKALGGGMLPVSTVLCDEYVMGLIKPGEHGSTFGGNPLACAVSIAALDVLAEEKLVQNSQIQGKILKQNLIQIFKGGEVQVRGKGLLIGIEFKRHNASDFCYHLIKYGVLTKATHERVIRFAPTLVIGSQDVAQISERVKRGWKQFV